MTQWGLFQEYMSDLIFKCLIKIQDPTTTYRIIQVAE